MNSIWVFGYSVGLDFNSGTPVPFQTSVISVENTASVSSDKGKLLFYCNGFDNTLRLPDHTVLQNSLGLYPVSYSSAQGLIIVPVIDTPWRFYVFSAMAYEEYNVASPPPYLSYSVVDMSLNNGLGAIEPGRKNVPLCTDVGVHEGMVAIPGDNCDVWLLTVASPAFYRLANSSAVPAVMDTIKFMAWHITEKGIDPTPVTSIPNSTFNSNRFNFSENSFWRNGMDFSSDRQRVVLGTSEGALLFKFDPITGDVTDGIQISRDRIYGTCFSPDNSKLYASRIFKGDIIQYNISQYDSIFIMSSECGINSGYSTGKLKLYKDTIYVSKVLGRSIDRINQPNVAGIGCDFERDAVNLVQGTFIGHGFCPDVVTPEIHHIASSIFDTICGSLDSGYVVKSLSAPPGFLLYEWDDGLKVSEREINSPGTYWVKYRNTACVIHTDTFHVSGLDLRFSFGPDRNLIFCDHPDSYLDLEVPFSNARCRWQDGTSDRFYRIRQAGNYWVEVMQGGCKATDTIQIHQTFLELGPDTFFCNGDEISMNLYATDFSPDIEVHWSTGASSPSIRIDAQGLYWVELIDLPCILFDSLNIQSIDCECGPHIPTAFSPNSDGINDFFLPLVASGCSVTRYSFNVYNRFGERVFSSTTFGQGWDGSYKGHPSDIGTYFYDLYYEGGVLWKKYYQKGDVTLIR